MKKRYLIYLLTLIMAFSPAAVFADAEAQTEPGDAVEASAELNDDADSAAVAPEQAAEEAQAEDAALTPAEEETVQSEAMAEEPEAVTTVDPYNACIWVDEYRNQAKDAAGTLRTGLFKASKDGGGTGLYYADSNAMVVKKIRVVTVSDGWRFEYHPYVQGQGEFWKDVSEGTYTYLINDHAGDFFIETEEGIYTAEGAKYYVRPNGTVRTDAGVQTFDGNKYYVQDGGAILTAAGWVNDTDGTRYYLPAETAADGKLRIAEGMFTADGKTWYSANGGAVRTTEGLFIYGGSQFYSFYDGSVNTAEGLITTGGKTYICAAGGAIRSTAGVVDFGGKKYVALADGSICTTPGFVNAGGSRYYVSDYSGALAVNKSFKVGSKLYHALADGTIGVGVHKWGKYYYYGDSNGAILKKKKIVSWAGYRYYVKKGGKITTNKKFKYKGKTYIAGPTGAFYKGIFTWKKNLYYASAKGVLRTKAGVFTYNGNKYCSKKGGKLYKNAFFTSGGKKYLAQVDGTLKAGILAWKGKLYLTDAKCAVITKVGMYTYGGHQYYVEKGGPLAVSEFVTYKDNHYYAGADGAIVKKKFVYKGVTLNPNATTGVIPLEEYWQVFPNEAPQEASN